MNSWLEYVQVRESREAVDPDQRHASLDVCFLGPYQDRRIHFHYEGVQGYSFEFKSSGPECQAIHGDVLTHELRKVGEIYEHEIAFEAGHSLVVKFTKFRHREEMIAAEKPEQS